MTADDVRRAIETHSSILAEHGVSAIYVFGSVARGESTEASDVDLLVDFHRTPGLIQFVRLQNRLAEILRRPVDLVTRNALKPQLKERILGEAVRAA